MGNDDEPTQTEGEESVPSETSKTLELAAAAEAFDKLGDKIEDLAMDFATESNPKLERMGLRYFDKRAKKLGPVDNDDEIHVLEPHELDAMQRVVRVAVFWAAVLGFLSGVASGLAEFFGAPLRGGPDASFGDEWQYHLLVHGVTIGATLLGIWALYFVGLRGVHDLAHAAGLSLDGAGREDAPAVQRAVAVALARAALELPNPPSNPFGINPYRELSKWRVFFAVLLFKLKITITTFVMRTLLARAATRAGVKAWLAFVSAPITAAWDAFVMWLVLRQARLRAMGTSAAQSMLDAIHVAHPELSRAAKETMARAVASSVVRSAELHPNHAALMALLPVRPADIDDIDDPNRLLLEMEALAESERIVVLQVLALAILIDGRLDKKERWLLRTVAGCFSHKISEEELRRLTRDFRAGRAFSIERIAHAVGAA